MEENNSHPLIVRGPDNIIEIPKRLQDVDGIKDIVSRTRARLSSNTYTLGELSAFFGEGKVVNQTHVPYLDFLEAIKKGNTILIQLLSLKRWKILCLVDMVEKGWSALETTAEGQVGIFHTGSKLSLGNISSQHLIFVNEKVTIPDLIEKQKQQPDIIAWRDRNF